VFIPSVAGWAVLANAGLVDLGQGALEGRPQTHQLLTKLLFKPFSVKNGLAHGSMFTII
jgi:hypothetical protein